MAQRRNIQGSVMGQGAPAFRVPDYGSGRLLSVPGLDTGLESRSPSSNPSPISPGSGFPDPLAVGFGLLPSGDQGFGMADNTNSLAGISSYVPEFGGPEAPCIDPINSTWTGPLGSGTFDPLSNIKTELERLRMTVQSSLRALDDSQLSEVKLLFSQTFPTLESMVQSEFELRIPSSPVDPPEDGYSYCCLLCPTSRSQACSKRGAFKRHVTHRHEAEYKYNCSFCQFSTPRRDKVHVHYRKSHGLKGTLTREQVNSLGVKLPAPLCCGICFTAVTSYAGYFECFASHCRVAENGSGGTSYTGSRKNSDDSGNGGGSFNGQNGSFGDFGGPGGFSSVQYGNGNGCSRGSSNPSFTQSFGYNNQYSKDVDDLHQHQSSAPGNQDPHYERTNPSESTNEGEKSFSVNKDKDHPDHQSKSTDTQQKPPATPIQHDSMVPNDQPEDKKAHPRGSINGILPRTLPRQHGTTDIRRCRTCGHGIDDCARCKNFGAAANSCHKCADKNCVRQMPRLQLPRLQIPRRVDEHAPPYFGPLDPDSTLAPRKSVSFPTYREEKTRTALKSLPAPNPEGEAPGGHPGERDIALQKLYQSLAVIARKQGTLRMPLGSRKPMSVSPPDKPATRHASEDSTTMVKYIKPRLERFSSGTWRRHTLPFESDRRIARFLQGPLRQGGIVFDIPFRIPRNHRLGSHEWGKTEVSPDSTPSATCRLSLRRHSLRGTMQVVVKLLRLRASVAKTQPDAEPTEPECVEDQSHIPNTLGSPKVDAEICMPYSYSLLSQIVHAIGKWNAGFIDHFPFKALHASGAVIDDDRGLVVGAFLSTLANIMQAPGHSGSIDLSQLSFL